VFRQMFEWNEQKPQTDEVYVADFQISTS